MTKAGQDHRADLVLWNGKVWTVDAHLPRAEAVAVCGNEILAVGSEADILPLIGLRTRIVDLHGQLVLPGFNDAHTHMIGAMLRGATAFNLYGVDTLDEVRARLHAHRDEHPHAPWLVGWRWDRSRFSDHGWPSCADLDPVESQRPVAIFDIDGHSCWTNTRALELLGYGPGTPDPVGGQILRDRSGQPTGILLETAHDPIPRNLNLFPEEFADLMGRLASVLNRLGITSISNNGIEPEQLDACLDLAAEDQLTLRINEWLFLAGGLEEAEVWRQLCAGNERVRVGGLKALLDGVLSAHTAWMLEPYADAPGQAGFPLVSPETLLAQALEADAQGFQLMIHAIGDRAVRRALDIYEQVAQANGRRDHRHRIEHVEVAHPADQRRFAELGVVANMTPLHCTAVIDTYIKDRLGEPRGEHAFSWRSLLDQGVRLCFGTDWPAVDLGAPNPLEQIFAAVTRTTPKAFGGPVWHGEQRLSVAEAIRSYTLESAYAEFMDHRKGSIVPGKLADLCVLSQDILEAPPEAILDTEVTMTVFDGEVVYVKS